MKNVLHLCKCNVQGGAEYSSDIIYDGGSIECIPDLVGENLSVVLERIGGFVCGLDIQMITTNEFEPSNEFGKDGDIHIREQEGSIDLYQKLNGEWTLVGSFPIGGGGGGVGDFVTINTDQFGLTGTKEWLGRHYFENTLAIPRSAPVDPDPTKAYIYVGPGSGAIPPETFGNLEDLQNVASPIPVNKFLYKGSDGIWVGVDAPGQDLTPYATKVWVGDNFYTKTIADGLFVTQLTDQTGLSGNKEWTGRHHFDGDLAIPQAAPMAPDPTKAYIYVGAGSGATPPSGSGNLEDLQNVDDLIVNNKFLYKGSDGIWVGADIPTPGNGLLTLNTGAGLQGSATFSANQTGSAIFTVSPASGHAIPTTGQITNWNTAYGWGNPSGKYMPIDTDGAAESVTSNINANTFYQTAALVVGTSSSNLPWDSAVTRGVIIQVGSSSSDSAAIAMSTGGSNYTNKMYFRSRPGNPWRQLWNDSNMRSDLDNDARFIQTLSTGISTGSILLSGGGGSIVLNSLNLGVSINNQFNLWASDLSAGFRPFYTSGGSSGLETEYNGGIYLKRSPGLDSRGSWGLYADIAPTQRKIRYVIGDSQTEGTHGTGALATEDWAAKNNFSGQIHDKHRDPTFLYGDNYITAYPNAGGTVISRIVDSTSPTGRALRFVATGWAQADVRITFLGMSVQSAPSKVFVVRIIAKIPVGWRINDAHNSSGSGYIREWITSNVGTGQWEEYVFKHTCGATGSFSTVNFFELRKVRPSTPDPSSANPVVSHVALATTIDTSLSVVDTRFRIPTTPPEYPLPGDVWVL